MRPESARQLLRRLRWTIRRPLATHLGGEERSLVRGAGMELAEIREYQPGGDLLLRQGNRVGALLFAERPLELVPPASGQGALLRVLDRLQTHPRQGATGPTDLAAAIERVAA